MKCWMITKLVVFKTVKPLYVEKLFIFYLLLITMNKLYQKCITRLEIIEESPIEMLSIRELCQIFKIF